MQATMAIINEIKCARCDRKYSGLRSRCPFCGARRTGSGKYSEKSNNMNSKMLISVLIMSVFAIGAGVLLFSTPVEADSSIPEPTPALTNPEDDINYQESLSNPPPTATPEPEPDIPTEVTAIGITYSGRVIPDFSLYPGEEIELGLKVEPESVVENNNMRIAWASSNEEQFGVVPILHDGNNWKAIAKGIASSGSAKLTVTVGNPEEGGMEFSINVYTRRKP